MLLKANVDIAIQNILLTAGFPVGYGNAPADLSIPYMILYPQGGPPGDGSWGSPEEDRWWNYQVTSVGREPVQVTWLTDKVRGMILDLSRYPIALTGGSIQTATSLRLGAIIQGGEDLWQAQDVYRVKAGI